MGNMLLPAYPWARKWHHKAKQLKVATTSSNGPTSPTSYDPSESNDYLPHVGVVGDKISAKYLTCEAYISLRYSRQVGIEGGSV